MGEARRRGTFEERKAAAIARKTPIMAWRKRVRRREREYKATRATVAVVVIAAILIMELLERAGVWKSF